jgi:Ca-activated chloride channel family protein
MRFKQPDSDQSMLVSEVVRTTDVATSMSSELSFASSVAGFGMLLRDSQYKGETDFELILDLAQNGILNDENGYRSEYLRLVQHAELLYPVSQ